MLVQIFSFRLTSAVSQLPRVSPVKIALASFVSGNWFYGTEQTKITVHRLPSGELVGISGLTDGNDDIVIGNVTAIAEGTRTLSCNGTQKISGMKVVYTSAVVESIAEIDCSNGPRPLQIVKNDPIMIDTSISWQRRLNESLLTSPMRDEDPIYEFVNSSKYLDFCSPYQCWSKRFLYQTNISLFTASPNAAQILSERQTAMESGKEFPEVLEIQIPFRVWHPLSNNRVNGTSST